MMTTDTLVSHPLADRFTKLRLPGMRAAFLEQIARRDLADMAFEDRLALLIDREITERRSRALQRRLKKARLHHQDACFEGIDLGRSRGLDRSLILGLARLDLIVLDDWGIAPIDAHRRRDLLEILDDRYNRRSVIVTSQIPVSDWHRQFNDPTIAEAILDRLVHTAYRIELTGPSMRADRSPRANQPNSA